MIVGYRNVQSQGRPKASRTSVVGGVRDCMVADQPLQTWPVQLIEAQVPNRRVRSRPGDQRNGASRSAIEAASATILCLHMKEVAQCI